MHIVFRNIIIFKYCLYGLFRIIRRNKYWDKPQIDIVYYFTDVKYINIVSYTKINHIVK